MACLFDPNALTLAGTNPPDTAAIAALINRQPADCPGVTIWDRQPWHPLFLDWQVGVAPMKAGGNAGSLSQTYDTRFLTDNYALAAGDSDLGPKPGAGDVAPSVATYGGRAILAGQAKDLMLDRLDDFIQRKVLPDYFQAANIAAAAQTGTDYATNVANTQPWYAARHAAGASSPGGAPDWAYVALMARALLASSDVTSQSLGGFNDALVMREQMMQIPVAAPLATAGEQVFAAAMAAAVAQQNITSPIDPGGFNPLRTGTRRFDKLCLIDTIALVTVALGTEFRVDLLGLSTALVPTPVPGGPVVTPVAFVEMALRAAFIPASRQFNAEARLTASSYLLSHQCHLYRRHAGRGRLRAKPAAGRGLG